MVHYLVVAHQTATSPELISCASNLAAEEPQAAFTILVPATPVDHLLTWEEGETQSIAIRRAEQARALFEERGLTVVDTKVGDASPISAIGDELRSRPDQYDCIVLSTLPPGGNPNSEESWCRLMGLNRLRVAQIFTAIASEPVMISFRHYWRSQLLK